MSSSENAVSITPGSEFSYRERANDFLELHDQVQTSVNLLDNLESFLSTFQDDLSAVSSQISDLQNRSKGIDSRLKTRKRIEKPLSSLISDIAISPQTARTILDTDVGEAWIPAVQDFEKRLETIKSRGRVKAARDLGDVAEGLRIVAATKLRIFFNALFRPIRASVTTNMQVVQSSVLMKFKPLYVFLKRQVPNVALELQRSYASAARVYYETGFRRYIRSLGYVKARTVEKYESIAAISSDKVPEPDQNRFKFAKIDGPAVTLAYIADDKNHKEPLEAILRSLLLVFMDNATSEYAFISSFFIEAEPIETETENHGSLNSPFGLTSPMRSGFFERRASTQNGSEAPFDSSMSATGSPLPTATFGSFGGAPISKDNQASADSLWKQALEPVMEYCQTFVKSILEPPPPLVPLLTCIRLTENVLAEVQRRSCPPVESFIFLLRLQMWPVFQKLMSENVDGMKKIVDGTGNTGAASYLGGFGAALGVGGATTLTSKVTDATIQGMSKGYIGLFNAFVALTEQEEETMIFSNLLRMRQELVKLIVKHSATKGDIAAQTLAQAAMYSFILHGLTRGTSQTAHPKAQQETAHWSNLDEEAKRKVVSMSQSIRR
ncbi:vacuolar sorting protein [Flagelloscypha sp. PMI_526]|nr:vacuolar sorting protein [Flagelloscypha sp. PMI_526]